MTPNKYTPFASKLEDMMSGIDSNVRYIRSMVTTMSGKLNELTDTVDAVCDTVNYEHQSPVSTSDDDWDFLSEDE